MVFRFPTAIQMAKYTLRINAKTHKTQLESALRVYQKQMVDLRNAMKQHSENGFSILKYEIDLPPSLQQYLRSQGYNVQSYWHINKPYVKISWYEKYTEEVKKQLK